MAPGNSSPPPPPVATLTTPASSWVSVPGATRMVNTFGTLRPPPGSSTVKDEPAAGVSGAHSCAWSSQVRTWRSAGEAFRTARPRSRSTLAAAAVPLGSPPTTGLPQRLSSARTTFEADTSPSASTGSAPNGTCPIQPPWGLCRSDDKALPGRRGLEGMARRGSARCGRRGRPDRARLHEARWLTPAGKVR